MGVGSVEKSPSSGSLLLMRCASVTSCIGMSSKDKAQASTEDEMQVLQETERRRWFK